MKENPKCPKCGSENTLPIGYGYPGPGMVEAYRKGELELGGCCISEDSPSWCCKDCKNSWGKFSIRSD